MTLRLEIKTFQMIIDILGVESIMKMMKIEFMYILKSENPFSTMREMHTMVRYLQSFLNFKYL